MIKKVPIVFAVLFFYGCEGGVREFAPNSCKTRVSVGSDAELHYVCVNERLAVLKHTRGFFKTSSEIISEGQPCSCNNLKENDNETKKF